MYLSTRTEWISAFTSSSVRALSCLMLHQVCCYISSELPAWINYSAPCHNSEDALITTDRQTRQRSKCTHSPPNLWPLRSLHGHLRFFCRWQLGNQHKQSSLDLQRAVVILGGKGGEYIFSTVFQAGFITSRAPWRPDLQRSVQSLDSGVHQDLQSTIKINRQHPVPGNSWCRAIKVQTAVSEPVVTFSLPFWEGEQLSSCLQ